jgi:hypothetical protein
VPAGYCERGKETSLSVREGNFLTSFGIVIYSRTPSVELIGWLVRKDELTGEGGGENCIMWSIHLLYSSSDISDLKLTC